MMLRLLRKSGKPALAAGYVDSYPGEIFRINGDSFVDQSPTKAPIATQTNVAVNNGAIVLGTNNGVSTYTTGQLEYTVGSGMNFGATDWMAEGEFTLPANMSVIGYFDIFTLGTYGSNISATLFKWASSASTTLRVYGPAGQLMDVTLDSFIKPGVRFKASLEHYQGRFYFYIDDNFVAMSQKIPASSLMNFPVQRARFGSDAMGKAQMSVHYFRIISGTAIASSIVSIYGAQAGTGFLGGAQNILDADDAASNYWYPAVSNPALAWAGIRNVKQMAPSKFDLQWGSSGVLTSWAIEYSDDDGATWTKAYSYSGAAQTAGLQTVEFAPSAARRWRMRYLAGTDIANKQLLRFIPGISTYYNATLQAQVIYGAENYHGIGYAGSATRAFDGDLNSTWYATYGTLADCWIGLGYLTPKAVNRVTVDLSNTHFLYGYVVEYSNDGTTWSNAATVTGISIQNGSHTVNFTEVTAKFWRWRITSTSNFANKEVKNLSFLKV